MSELKAHIIDTFGFSEGDYDRIEGFFEPIVINKGGFFLEQGKRVTQMGFVERGILREFLYANGKEVTKWFSTSGYFAVDLSGFLHKRNSKVSYQAINDASMLTLSKENYDRIGTVVPEWEKLEKLFLIKCFAILEDRVVSHLSMNAEERYRQMFEFQPQLFNEAPLNYLASMLGMTPETLSRIRNKLSRSDS